MGLGSWASRQKDKIKDAVSGVKDWYKRQEGYLRYTFGFVFEAYEAVYDTVQGLFHLSELLEPDIPGIKSGNYQSDTPVITVKEGTPIPKCYGRCRIAGNIIRNNDYGDEKYIKFIVSHCEGPIENMDIGNTSTSGTTGIWGSVKINDKEFDDISINDVPPVYYLHTGTTQSQVNNLFTSKACNFRGITVSEVNVPKNNDANKNEISGLQNAVFTGKFQKCIPIGSGSTQARVWSRNPAVVLWDWYIDVEKYNIEDLNENAFTALETYCNQYSNNPISVPLSPLGLNYTGVSATNHTWTKSNGRGWRPYYALDRTLPVIDEATQQSWMATATADQALHIDLGCQYVITKIVIENFHSTGDYTSRGIKQFVVQGTNSRETWMNNDGSGITYAGVAGWTIIGGASGSSLTASQHVDLNAEDPEEFTIGDGNAYRYVRLKIQDNHGATKYTGLRKVIVYGYSPRYTFDYIFDKAVPINDAKKLIWKSFNGSSMMSQGTIKPVWNAAQEHDGSGGLQTKTSKHDFNLDNIVKNSFSWGTSEFPNVTSVKFINAHNEYKKETIEFKDEKSIEDKGEIKASEEAFYITEKDVAIRRCRFLYDKAKYSDFHCQLSSLPDAQHLELYDLVTVTHPYPGWSQKQFIVLKKTEGMDGLCVFNLLAYYSGVYQDKGFELQENYGSNLPKPSQEIGIVDGASLSDTSYWDANGNWISNITLTYTPSKSPYYSHSIINLQVNDTNGDTDFFEYGVDQSYGNGFTISSDSGLFEPGYDVTAQIVAVNTLGRASGSSETVSIKINAPDLADTLPNLIGEGGRIYLPKGTYTLTSAVTLPNKNLSLIGVDRGGVTITSAGSGERLFNIVDSSKTYSFKNFTVDSGNNGGTGSSMFNIKGTSVAKNTCDIIMDNINFKLWGNGVIGGATSDVAVSGRNNSGIITIKNCKVNNGSYGFLFPKALNLIFHSNKIDNIQNMGISASGTSDIFIKANELTNIFEYGIFVNGTDKTPANIEGNSVFFKDLIHDPSDNLIGIRSALKTNMIGNSVVGVMSSSTLNSITCFSNSGGGANYSNNYVNIQSASTTLTGIIQSGGDDSTFRGNTIFVNNTSQRSVRTDETRGILIANQSDRNVISNNTIDCVNNNAADKGIVIVGDNNYGDGNITYNVGTSIDDSGAGNNVTAQDV